MQDLGQLDFFGRWVMNGSHALRSSTPVDIRG
jgi:hypothetical protein